MGDAIAEPRALSTLRDLLTDLLTNAPQPAATRWDGMGSESGEVPAHGVLRGTVWDALVGTQVGLGPGARKGVQVQILSRAPHLTRHDAGRRSAIHSP
jgi:hypothetical protein